MSLWQISRKSIETGCSLLLRMIRYMSSTVITLLSYLPNVQGFLIVCLPRKISDGRLPSSNLICSPSEMWWLLDEILRCTLLVMLFLKGVCAPSGR